jgi:hypothetical protein
MSLASPEQGCARSKIGSNAWERPTKPGGMQDDKRT